MSFDGQIVEYEDYDNTTDFYQEKEYEYEEEYDDRYGPAEREREFSLNAQVHYHPNHPILRIMENRKRLLWINAAYCVCLSMSSH